MFGCCLGPSRLVDSVDMLQRALREGSRVERESVLMIIYFCWLTHTKSDWAWWWWWKKKRSDIVVASEKVAARLFYLLLLFHLIHDYSLPLRPSENV